jgi:hypothetical protein
MNIKRNVLLLGATLLLGCTQVEAAPQGCNRGCLYGLMDSYLKALVAHDPKQAPFAPAVKYTENTNRMAPGDGLWQTITSLGTYKLYAADPHLGSVVYYGTAKENGQLVLFAVRLHQQAQRITEAEGFVIRKSTGIHGSFENLKDVDPVWAQPLAAGDKLSRTALIHAANQYFNGIEQGNGDIVPFDDDCIRIENGLQTAPSTASAAGALSGHPPMTAREQFNSKAFRYITQVTQRRFLVVDEEDGIVFATVMFQHPGNVPTADWAKTGLPANPNGLSAYPNTTQIIEAFKIRHGKLFRIFAYVSLLPYRQSPGW